MRQALVVAALLLLPAAAGAAGFAKQSIFLSTASVTEGDTVLIHAVVQNTDAATFPGTVVIKDGEEKVGSVAVELEAGKAQAVSVSWEPKAGSRTIVAELTNKAGEVVESESETFSIKTKPTAAGKTASSSNAAAVGSSDAIQEQIHNVSPAVGGAVAPFFKLVDGGRESMADVLDAQLKSIGPKVTQIPLPGVVAGAETVETPKPAAWFWSIFYTIYFYILTVLRYVVGSAGLFYPLIAVLFLLVLYKMFRRFRRR